MEKIQHRFAAEMIKYGGQIVRRQIKVSRIVDSRVEKESIVFD